MSENDNASGNWEDNPALVKVFSEMDLDDYLQGFRKGDLISQQEIEYLELLADYLIEKGKNQKLKEDLRGTRNLLKDLRGMNTSKQKHREKKSRLFVNLDIGKIPPQNVPLEEIVLGSYINLPKLMEEGNFTQPYVNKFWYKEENLKVHNVLMNSTRRVNKQTIISDLMRLDELDDVGGVHYIEQLANNKEITDDINTIDTYLRELEHHSGKRELIAFAQNLINLAFEENGIDSVPEEIRNQSAKLSEIMPFRFRQHYDKTSAVFQIKQELKEMENRKGYPKISTGFKKLDRVTHGILPGKLIINGARGKMGKTVYTTGIAKNVVNQGYDIAYFSHEVLFKEMINRLVAEETGVEYSRFEFNPQGFTKREKEKIDEAFEKIEKSGFHLESRKPASLEYIINRSKQFKSMYPDLALIVFDGLQAYESLVPDRGNKSDFFTKVMGTMKYDIAEPLGVTVMLNAQLKSIIDEKYVGPDKNYRGALFKPSATGQFSDCKGIKDICDGAFGLWRGDYYFPDNKSYKNKLEIIPLDLRNDNRHTPPFNIGIDIGKMKVYDI